MRHFVLVVAANALLAAIAPLASIAAPPSVQTVQTSSPRIREQTQASYASHQAEFDYLLGDWEFTGLRREPAGELKFRGYWSALRLVEGGQILDEYRVVGDDGETNWATATLRAYNGNLGRWELVSTETGTGLQNVGTGHREGAEMRIEQRFGEGGPVPSLWRIRYYDIRPERFSWSGDRSLDGGKTWVEGFQQIEARRIGPPRSLGPLAPARNGPGAAPPR